MSDLGKAARKLASKGRLEWPHPQFGPPGLHTKRTHRHQLTWLFIFNARDTLAKHMICTKRQSFILPLPQQCMMIQESGGVFWGAILDLFLKDNKYFVKGRRRRKLRWCVKKSVLTNLMKVELTGREERRRRRTIFIVLPPNQTKCGVKIWKIRITVSLFPIHFPWGY